MPLTTVPNSSAAVSGRHFQPKPEIIIYVTKRNILVSSVSSELSQQAASLCSSGGSRLLHAVVMSGCEGTFPPRQYEPQGENHPKATTPQTRHKMANVHPLCRDNGPLFEQQMIQVCQQTSRLCCFLLALCHTWCCVFSFPLWPVSRFCLERLPEEFFQLNF